MLHMNHHSTHPLCTTTNKHGFFINPKYWFRVLAYSWHFTFLFLLKNTNLFEVGESRHGVIIPLAVFYAKDTNLPHFLCPRYTSISHVVK
jgi:hypothetical protein